MTDPVPKPSVVLLHGWTMEGSIFDNVIDLMGDGFACHAPDLPGHGERQDNVPVSIDGCADFVTGYLAAHGIERPVLVGWSLGAMVAWNLTRRYRQIPLKGIVAIDMSPKIVNGPHWHLGICHFEARQNQKTLVSIGADWKAFAARVNAGMYAAGSNEPHPETLLLIRRKEPAAMATLWASLAEADERETLHELGCPLLVVRGAKSRLYPPETSRYLLEHAPGSELACFENSGHSPHLEEPGRFAAVLRAWVQGLDQSSS